MASDRGRCSRGRAASALQIGGGTTAGGTAEGTAGGTAGVTAGGGQKLLICASGGA